MTEAQDAKIAALEKELVIASEMLAQVLYAAGPVKVTKGVQIPPSAHIEVDFDPKGEYAIVELKNAK